MVSLVVVFIAALVALWSSRETLFWTRTELPSHLLGHSAFFEEAFVDPEDALALMDVIKNFRTIPTNAQDLKFYSTKHEHIGEAVALKDGKCEHPLMIPNGNRTLCTFPGRMDIGRHYIMSGGHESLKETYERLVSRLLSFGVYIFNPSDYPALQRMFDRPEFQRFSRLVCPKDKQYLDPFQFNFIINTPGQTVAHHIDGVYFWGATRFEFPQWLLAVMKFSGLYEDRFINQVQVVAYLHRWSDERDGKFVYWTDNGEAKSMDPKPLSANVVDGSKVVHAATVYRANSTTLPTLPPSAENQLIFQGDDEWIIKSAGKTVATLKTDDLRISVVYRARCFANAEEAHHFNNLEEKEKLTLDEVLATLKADLVKRGVLSVTDAKSISAFDLGMLLVKTYIKYPLSPKAVIPYNYCALSRLFPWTAGLLRPLCG